MKSIGFKTLIITVLIGGFLSSCVSSKKFKELQEKRDQAETLNLKLKDQNRMLTTLNTELKSKVDRLSVEKSQLEKDSLALGKRFRYVLSNYKSLNNNYKDLLQKYNDALAGNRSETSRLLAELQKTQKDLMRREDSLAVLEKDYQAKKSNLEQLSQELENAKQVLAQKEKAYNDLRTEMERKDSIMTALKTSVSNALSGFENNGLTITRKNGQVYVSMDEKLLFPSGSFKVNPKGKEALVKLAKVLEDNADIKVLVEGHTDSIPYRGSGNLKDNWDLSVKRATSIVRVLTLNSKMDPQKITAAGRGAFVPVASNATKEGRAKNRRTEIILQPNLEKLYELVK